MARSLQGIPLPYATAEMIYLESSNLRGNVVILVKLGCLLQLGLHIIQRLLHLHMGCP